MPLAIAGAWLAWGRIRQGKEPRWIMVFLWAAALPLGFSIALHKVHYYILPTYAATALLVGLACDRWVSPVWRNRLVNGTVILAGVAGLAFFFLPVPVHKVRYAEALRMAPRLDAFLVESPGDLLVVRQDAASMFFYTQKIGQLRQVHHWPSFAQVLAEPSPQRRYCLIGRADWEMVDPEIRIGWETLWVDGDRLLLRQEPKQTAQASV